MTPVKIKSEDLRIKKTYKALINAIHTLLLNKNFNQITVNDICSEALLSRATFYLHFADKYDLLEYWLLDVNIYLNDNLSDYKTLEKNLNQSIKKNKCLIANVFVDANPETLDLLNNFVLKIVTDIINRNGKPNTEESKILANFCTGGIIKMLSLYVKENFSRSDFMTPMLYEMINMILKWDRELGDI